MAEKFVLTAQLQLQAPRNVRTIVRNLRRDLGRVKVPIVLDVKGRKDVEKLTKDLKNAGNSAKKASTQMTSFGKAVNQVARDLTRIGSLLLIREFADAAKGAAEFERELVKVSQVTGTALRNLGGLRAEITRLSTSLGVSSKSLVEASRVLSQTGITARETTIALEALAKSSLAPTFSDIKNTTETAIAAMKQFKLEAKDLNTVLGQINAVAGQFAVEASDIGVAIRRAGGVFQKAGGQLEELEALFTSVRSTTRESAETIATGFRTIFTRLQRPRTIKFLRQMGIELTDLKGKFIGPRQAIEALSLALKDLDPRDIRFAQITEQLGGFRQVSKVIPLIKEYEVTQRALNVARAGGLSLDRDAATAQQALLVRVTKVKEAFNALIRTIADNSAIKTFIDGSLRLAEALLKVTSALEPLLPLLTGLATVGIARGVGRLAGGIGRSGGGRIQKFATGGFVPGTGNRDTVPAMLTPGEFVIKKSSAESIGGDRLHRMNKYAAGGRVTPSRRAYGGRRYDYFYNNRKYSNKNALFSANPHLGPGTTANPNPINPRGGGISRRDEFIRIRAAQRGERVEIREKGAAASKTKTASKAKQAESDVEGKRGPSVKRKAEGATPTAGATQWKHKIEIKPHRFGGLFLRPIKDKDLPTQKKDLPWTGSGSPQHEYVSKILAAEVPGKYRNSKKAREIIGSRLQSNSIKPVQFDAAFFKRGLRTKITKHIPERIPKLLAKLGTEPSANRVLGGTGLNVTETDIKRQVKKQIKDKSFQMETIQGILFESFVGAITGTPLTGQQDKWDFPNINASKFRKIFVEVDQRIKHGDAKRTYESKSFGSGRGAIGRKFLDSLRGKAGAANITVKDMNLAPDLLTDVANTAKATESSGGKSGGSGAQTAAKGGIIRQRLAGGGSSGTDTVPALLTPGEFVINRGSAQRIGYDRLNRANNTGTFAAGGRVRRYAKGGPVQRFQTGGTAAATGGGGFEKLFLLTAVAGQLVQTFDGANKGVAEFIDRLSQAAIVFVALSSLNPAQKFGAGGGGLGGGGITQSLFGGGAAARQRASLAAQSQLVVETEAEAGKPISDMKKKERKAFRKKSRAVGKEAAQKRGELGAQRASRAFAVAGTAALALGQFLKKGADQALESAKTEAEASAAVTKAATAGAVQMGGLGLAIGAQFGPIGAVVGAAVGAIGGFVTAAAEARKKLKKIKFDRTFAEFEKSIKLAGKKGVDAASQSAAIAEGIAAAQARFFTAADPQAVAELNNKLRRSVPALDTYIQKIKNNAESFEALERIVGTNVIKEFTRLTGQTLKQFEDQIRKEIEARKKAKEVQERLSQVQEEAFRKLLLARGIASAFKDLQSAVNQLNAGFKTIGQSLSGQFGKVEVFDALKGLGDPTSIADLGKFNSKIGVATNVMGLAGKDLSKEAKSFATVFSALPDILSSAAQEPVFEGDEGDLVAKVLRKIEALGNVSELTKRRLKAQLEEMTGGEDPGKLRELIRKDLDGLVKNLGKGSEGIFKALSEAAKFIQNSTKALSSGFNQRTKAEILIAKKRLALSEFTLKKQQALAKATGKKINLDKIFNDFKLATDQLLAGTRVSGLGGNVDAIGNELARLKEEIKTKRDEINDIPLDGGAGGEDELRRRQRLIDETERLQEKFGKVSLALERYASAQARLAAVQTELAAEQKKRQQSFGAAAQFTFGGRDQRQQQQQAFFFTKLAAITGNINNVPDEFKGAVSGVLDQLSEVKLFGGQETGKEIKTRLVANQLRQLGVPPELIKAITERTSKEDKLIDRLREVFEQAQRAREAQLASVVDDRRRLHQDLRALNRQLITGLERILLGQAKRAEQREKTSLQNERANIQQQRDAFDKFNELTRTGAGDLTAAQVSSLRAQKALFIEAQKAEKKKGGARGLDAQLAFSKRLSQLGPGDPGGGLFRGVQEITGSRTGGARTVPGGIGRGAHLVPEGQEIETLFKNIESGLADRFGVQFASDFIALFRTKVFDAKENLLDDGAFDLADVNKLLITELAGFTNERSRVNDVIINKAKEIGRQLGFVPEQIQRFIDNADRINEQLSKIPIGATIASLDEKLNNLGDSIQGATDRINDIGGRQEVVGPAAQGFQPVELRKGGTVYASDGGFTPKGTDVVPAMLSAGEFVVNKRATRANLPALQAMNKGGGVRYYQAGGFVVDPELKAQAAFVNKPPKQNERGDAYEPYIAPFFRHLDKSKSGVTAHNPFWLAATGGQYGMDAKNLTAESFRGYKHVAGLFNGMLKLEGITPSLKRDLKILLEYNALGGFSKKVPNRIIRGRATALTRASRAGESISGDVIETKGGVGTSAHPVRAISIQEANRRLAGEYSGSSTGTRRFLESYPLREMIAHPVFSKSNWPTFGGWKAYFGGKTHSQDYGWDHFGLNDPLGYATEAAETTHDGDIAKHNFDTILYKRFKDEHQKILKRQYDYIRGTISQVLVSEGQDKLIKANRNDGDAQKIIDKMIAASDITSWNLQKIAQRDGSFDDIAKDDFHLAFFAKKHGITSNRKLHRVEGNGAFFALDLPKNLELYNQGGAFELRQVDVEAGNEIWALNDPVSKITEQLENIGPTPSKEIIPMLEAFGLNKVAAAVKKDNEEEAKEVQAGKIEKEAARLRNVQIASDELFQRTIENNVNRYRNAGVLGNILGGAGTVNKVNKGRSLELIPTMRMLRDMANSYRDVTSKVDRSTFEIDPQLADRMGGSDALLQKVLADLKRFPVYKGKSGQFELGRTRQILDGKIQEPVGALYKGLDRARRDLSAATGKNKIQTIGPKGNTVDFFVQDPNAKNIYDYFGVSKEEFRSYPINKKKQLFRAYKRKEQAFVQGVANPNIGGDPDAEARRNIVDRGLARGGPVYLSKGQSVSFTPRGTDTVPAMLTPGEFVVNRKSAQSNLPLLKSINSGKKMSRGGMVYLQAGGQAGRLSEFDEILHNLKFFQSLKNVIGGDLDFRTTGEGEGPGTFEEKVAGSLSKAAESLFKIADPRTAAGALQQGVDIPDRHTKSSPRPDLLQKSRDNFILRQQKRGGSGRFGTPSRSRIITGQTGRESGAAFEQQSLLREASKDREEHKANTKELKSFRSRQSRDQTGTTRTVDSGTSNIVEAIKGLLDLQDIFDDSGIIGSIFEQTGVSRAIKEVESKGFQDTNSRLKDISKFVSSMNIYGKAPLRTIDQLASSDLLERRTQAREAAGALGVPEGIFDIRGGGGFGQPGFMDVLDAEANVASTLGIGRLDVSAMQMARIIAGLAGSFEEFEKMIGFLRLNQVTGFASGGTIFKPKGTDTVPAMLTPGEFVIRKAAVDAVGVGTLSKINAMGYANGGVVGGTELNKRAKTQDKLLNDYTDYYYAKTATVPKDSVRIVVPLETPSEINEARKKNKRFSKDSVFGSWKFVEKGRGTFSRNRSADVDYLGTTTPRLRSEEVRPELSRAATLFSQGKKYADSQTRSSMGNIASGFGPLATAISSRDRTGKSHGVDTIAFRYNPSYDTFVHELAHLFDPGLYGFQEKASPPDVLSARNNAIKLFKELGPKASQLLALENWGAAIQVGTSSVDRFRKVALKNDREYFAQLTAAYHTGKFENMARRDPSLKGGLDAVGRELAKTNPRFLDPKKFASGGLVKYLRQGGPIRSSSKKFDPLLQEEDGFAHHTQVAKPRLKSPLSFIPLDELEWEMQQAMGDTQLKELTGAAKEQEGQKHAIGNRIEAFRKVKNDLGETVKESYEDGSSFSLMFPEFFEEYPALGEAWKVARADGVYPVLGKYEGIRGPRLAWHDFFANLTKKGVRGRTEYDFGGLNERYVGAADEVHEALSRLHAVDDFDPINDFFDGQIKNDVSSATDSWRKMDGVSLSMKAIIGRGSLASRRSLKRAGIKGKKAGYFQVGGVAGTIQQDAAEAKRAREDIAKRKKFSRLLSPQAKPLSAQNTTALKRLGWNENPLLLSTGDARGQLGPFGGAQNVAAGLPIWQEWNNYLNPAERRKDIAAARKFLYSDIKTERKAGLSPRQQKSLSTANRARQEKEAKEDAKIDAEFIKRGGYLGGGLFPLGSTDFDSLEERAVAINSSRKAMEAKLYTKRWESVRKQYTQYVNAGTVNPLITEQFNRLAERFQAYQGKVPATNKMGENLNKTLAYFEKLHQERGGLPRWTTTPQQQSLMAQSGKVPYLAEGGIVQYLQPGGMAQAGFRHGQQHKERSGRLSRVASEIAGESSSLMKKLLAGKVSKWSPNDSTDMLMKALDHVGPIQTRGAVGLLKESLGSSEGEMDRMMNNPELWESLLFDPWNVALGAGAWKKIASISTGRKFLKGTETASGLAGIKEAEEAGAFIKELRKIKRGNGLGEEAGLFTNLVNKFKNRKELSPAVISPTSPDKYAGEAWYGMVTRLKGRLIEEFPRDWIEDVAFKEMQAGSKAPYDEVNNIMKRRLQELMTEEVSKMTGLQVTDKGTGIKFWDGLIPGKSGQVLGNVRSVFRKPLGKGVISANRSRGRTWHESGKVVNISAMEINDIPRTIAEELFHAADMASYERGGIKLPRPPNPLTGKRRAVQIQAPSQLQPGQYKFASTHLPDTPEYRLTTLVGGGTNPKMTNALMSLEGLTPEAAALNGMTQKEYWPEMYKYMSTRWETYAKSMVAYTMGGRKGKNAIKEVLGPERFEMFEELAKKIIERKPEGFRYGGQVKHFQAGGKPMGTDTVPAMLTPGEFVVRKEAVNAIGVGNLNRINAMGFAKGGPVQYLKNGGGLGTWGSKERRDRARASQEEDYQKWLERRNKGGKLSFEKGHFLGGYQKFTYEELNKRGSIPGYFITDFKYETRRLKEQAEALEQHKKDVQKPFDKDAPIGTTDQSVFQTPLEPRRPKTALELIKNVKALSPPGESRPVTAPPLRPPSVEIPPTSTTPTILPISAEPAPQVGAGERGLAPQKVPQPPSDRSGPEYSKWYQKYISPGTALKSAIPRRRATDPLRMAEDIATEMELDDLLDAPTGPDPSPLAGKPEQIKPGNVKAAVDRVRQKVQTIRKNMVQSGFAPEGGGALDLPDDPLARPKKEEVRPETDKLIKDIELEQKKREGREKIKADVSGYASSVLSTVKDKTKEFLAKSKEEKDRREEQTARIMSAARRYPPLPPGDGKFARMPEGYDVRNLPPGVSYIKSKDKKTGKPIISVKRSQYNDKASANREAIVAGKEGEVKSRRKDASIKKLKMNKRRNLVQRIISAGARGDVDELVRLREESQNIDNPISRKGFERLVRKGDIQAEVQERKRKSGPPRRIQRAPLSRGSRYDNRGGIQRPRIGSRARGRQPTSLGRTAYSNRYGGLRRDRDFYSQRPTVRVQRQSWGPTTAPSMRGGGTYRQINTLLDAASQALGIGDTEQFERIMRQVERLRQSMKYDTGGMPLPGRKTGYVTTPTRGYDRETGDYLYRKQVQRRRSVIPNPAYGRGGRFGFAAGGLVSYLADGGRVARERKNSMRMLFDRLPGAGFPTDEEIFVGYGEGIGPDTGGRMRGGMLAEEMQGIMRQAESQQRIPTFLQHDFQTHKDTIEGQRESVEERMRRLMRADPSAANAPSRHKMITDNPIGWEMERRLFNKENPLPGFNKGGNVDSVPAMLTPGEFVVRKEAVDAVGVGTLQNINRMGYNAGGVVYARGGGAMPFGGRPYLGRGANRQNKEFRIRQRRMRKQQRIQARRDARQARINARSRGSQFQGGAPGQIVFGQPGQTAGMGMMSIPPQPVQPQPPAAVGAGAGGGFVQPALNPALAPTQGGGQTAGGVGIDPSVIVSAIEQLSSTVQTEIQALATAMTTQQGQQGQVDLSPIAELNNALAGLTQYTGFTEFSNAVTMLSGIGPFQVEVPGGVDVNLGSFESALTSKLTSIVTNAVRQALGDQPKTPAPDNNSADGKTNNPLG